MGLDLGFAAGLYGKNPLKARVPLPFERPILRVA
jgi:hypothetical protein